MRKKPDSFFFSSRRRHTSWRCDWSSDVCSSDLARRLLGRRGTAWQLTGIDPEGIDLRREGETARLDFAAPVLTPAMARRVLVALAETARETPGGWALLSTGG